MDVEQESFLKRQLLTKQSAYINLYILNASQLASRDIGSASDPYIEVTLGNKVKSTVDRYKNDEENPDFYEVFSFNSEFPGCSIVNIKIMDFDDLFGDDMVGETNIDLEDRFFSHEW